MLKEYISRGEKDTRSGFGDGIYELGKENPEVVALTADLAGSLKLNKFMDEFPERFVQVGIAEANMIGVSSGLAIAGKIPFATTFANFATSRVYDQIRQVVAYSNKNVKICASHAGLTLGEDGATHQVLEDIGMMKMLPNMTVIVPADYSQTKAATKAIAKMDGPVYLRFGRPTWPMFTSEDGSDFQIGKAQVMIEGKDATIIACGHLVWFSLEAAKVLAQKGIEVEVINMHTIKPLDSNAILASVSKTGCVVTAEEHQKNGGLGESVATLLAENNPAPQEFVAVNDTFGESGKPKDLLKKYGLSIEDIVTAVEKVVKRK